MSSIVYICILYNIYINITFDHKFPCSWPASAAAGWPPSEDLHLTAGLTAASAVSAIAALCGGAAVAPSHLAHVASNFLEVCSWPREEINR